jgi:hypothetical protein
VLVECRGLDSALEAVRVSVEAVRVSVEAVRVSIEAKKVPVEVVREPVGKTVLKILEQIKTFWFCSKIFRLNGKVLHLF